MTEEGDYALGRCRLQRPVRRGGVHGDGLKCAWNERERKRETQMQEFEAAGIDERREASENYWRMAGRVRKADRSQKESKQKA